ncbi:hypothetical protein CPB97_010591 [Podila verticillata]|nr:hypothetical protein CPB97_010591 [Podila verticillata]
MAPVIQPVAQERLDSQIRNIEEILERTPELKPSLETLLENIARNEYKREQEAGRLKQFWAAHPERLVVPSVKKLALYGRWSLSEEVLETMLGQVFRNVESIGEFLSEGYSMSGIVRATQAMPWLKTYHSVRYFDPETCQGDCRLKQFTEYPIAPLAFTNNLKPGLSLVQLLLRSVPADTCSGLVKAAYELDLLDAPPQHWAIDYLSFVRPFQPQDLLRSSLLVLTSARIPPLSPQMMEYIEAHSLREKYDALALPIE